MDPSDSSAPYYLLTAGASLLLLSFISYSVTLLFRASTEELEDIEKRGGIASRLLRRMLRRQERVRQSADLWRIVLYFVSISSVFIYLASITNLQTPFYSVGTTLASLLVVVILLTVFYLFFQIVPTSIASGVNKDLLGAFVLPLYLVLILLRPIILLFEASQKLIQPAKSEPEPSLSAPDLELYLKSQGEQGALEPEERGWISSIFTYGERTVREIMLPRTDVCALPIRTSLHDFLELLKKTGHSRYPVYEGSIDNILGILHVKDLLKMEDLTQQAQGTPLDLSNYVRPPFITPESKRLDELLKEMRAKRAHMAIVLDEYGGTSGMVTLEDIVEEIFGEIQDEYDVGEEIAIQETSGGASVMSASVPVHEFNDHFDSSLPDDYDTVAGLIMGKLGKIPEVGETCIWEPFEFKVLEVSRRRIRKVLVTRLKDMRE